MTHWHADIIENGRFTDRSECFFGRSALARAKKWLIDEMESDAGMAHPVMGWSDRASEMIQEWLHAAIPKVDAYDGQSEAVSVPITVGKARVEYRIMRIDGACERTLEEE